MQETHSVPLQASNAHASGEASPDLLPRQSSNPSWYISPWLQVIGSFCLNLNTWGLLASFGVYQSYYSLEMLQGVAKSKISWIGSTQGFFMFVVSFLIGPIFDAGYLHFLLLAGSLLCVLGVFMTSLCTQYWQLFLSQGVTIGIGCGCLYLPAPALVSMHFQRNQSLAMGLSSAGSGIGAVIFPAIFTHLENRAGFAWATRVIGFVTLSTSIIPLALMRYPEGRQPVDSNRALPGRSKVRHSLGQYLDHLIDKTAFQDGPLVSLVAGLTVAFMGIYVMLYYVNLLADQRTSAPRNVASQSLTILNGASTVGRILPSFLADHIGPIHILAITSCLSGVLAFSSLALRNTSSLVVWSIAFGSFTGAFQGLPAAGVVSVSESRTNIGVKLGMTLGCVGCGVLVAEPVAGAILGPNDDGWTGVVCWSGSLMFTGFILVLLARFKKTGNVVRVRI